MSQFASQHFISLPLSNGVLIELAQEPFPTTVWGWGHKQGNTLQVSATGTLFGYVIEGTAVITRPEGGCGLAFPVGTGMFFSSPAGVSIVGGRGILIGSNSQGVFLIGGPIEQEGRLRYIDGCSDSLLIPPTFKGDPCLNYLHFPPHTNQTKHTHPSIRVGVIARGQGHCIVTSDQSPRGHIAVPLVPGYLFLIPTGGEHSFVTEDQSMDVIAYHPDSDFGPEHDVHPMINRTFVEGESAANIDAIKTRRAESDLPATHDQ